MTAPSSTGPADTVVELEFAMSSPSHPFVAASAETDCLFELEEFFPRGDGSYAEFYSIRGGDLGRVVELAEAHGPSEATVLAEYDDGGLLEMHVWDDCPAVSLAEAGALPRQVVGDRGTGLIVAEVPPGREAAEIGSRFLERYDDAELVARRRKESITPLFGSRELQRVVDDHLTDKQREALRVALEAGYYEWPREATGEELAESLEIAPATFSEHLRSAERKLLTALLADPSTRSTDSAAP